MSSKLFKVYNDFQRKCKKCGSKPSFINGEWLQCSDLYCGDGGWFHEKCQSETIGTMYDIAFPSWNGTVEVWKDNKPQTEVITLQPYAEREFILRKCSGIKDLNNNYIFAGDMIESSFGDYVWRYVVREINGLGNNLFAVCFYRNFRKDEDGNDYWGDCYIKDNRSYHHIPCKSLIIGNIYENPELLEVPHDTKI